MIKTNIKTLLILCDKIFFIVLFSFFLHACSPEQNKVNKEEISESTKPIIPDIINESLNDTSSYDMARFQFQGRLEGRDTYEIWSIKIDGSDLRLVLAKNELYSDGFGNLSHDMSRSPNNRYVMLVQDPDHGLSTEPDKGSNSRVLYDLKTRERTVIISRGAVIPSIRWTQDSNYVMFYSWSYEDSESYLYKYDVKEKKLIKGPAVHSYEFYPVKNDSEFVAITKQGFDIYNWQGKKLKVVKLAEQISTREHTVSRNGDYLVYKLIKGVDPAFYIINLNKPHQKLYTFKGRSRNFMLDHRGQYLYFLGFDGMERIELLSKLKEKIISPPDYLSGFVNFSLYNDRER